MWISLVWVVVVCHFAVTLLVAVGGFLVWQWKVLFWPHMALLAWAASIPVFHPPCPLTDLEKLLRARAGLPVYETHFIDHYIYAALQPHPWVFDLLMLALPLLSYALLALYGRQALLGRA